MPKIIEAGVELYALSAGLMAELEALAKKVVYDKCIADRVEAGVSSELAQRE